MSKAQRVFGQNLKAFRKKACMTQPQLAKASSVATSIVNDVENGIQIWGANVSGYGVAAEHSLYD